MTFKQRLALNYIRSKFAVQARLNPSAAATSAFQFFCSPKTRYRPALPHLFQEAENLTIDFKGINLRGYRWNAGATHRILILHGFESSVLKFERYAKAMIAKGYEVLAFDAPAHGRSEGNSINVLVYSQVIEKILERFGPVKNFIAHSMGGLSLALALERLIPSADTKVVLIAPLIETTTSIQKFFHFLRLPGSLEAPFEKLIVEAGKHPSSWYSLARVLKHLKIKMLIVHDKDDELTPYSDLKPIIESRPENLQFHITQGLGHSRIYKEKNIVSLVIDFFD